MPRDLETFRPLTPKINEFPGLVMKHFYVEFGDPSSAVFEISCGKTDRQTRLKMLPLPLTSAWVIMLIFRSSLYYRHAHCGPSTAFCLYCVCVRMIVKRNDLWRILSLHCLLWEMLCITMWPIIQLSIYVLQISVRPLIVLIILHCFRA